MHQDHNAPPFNPMPPVVWVLFLILMGIEVVFTLGEQGIVGGARAVGWRLGAISDYGFSGVAFDWMVKNGQMPFEYVIRCFSYMFLHGSFTAAIFSGVILLAMGKLVGEVMGQLAVIILFVFSGVFGVVIFGLLTDQAWLIGAYPSVYGLIGAYTFLLWQRVAGQGMQQLTAFRLIGFLMGIQLIFGIFFVTGQDWVAELAGFICGFSLSVIVMPGGIARLRAAIQRN
ncbi:rhomboid family intramembrane serine protease [bacterium]|jgi:membrane associated rhomboid family serine protease|nr:rhomboid family intramembrane serine protease [bacterium]